jgi:hypothetical protein
MVRKVVLYGSIFFFLVSANLSILSKLAHKNKANTRMSEVLYEIEQPPSFDSQFQRSSAPLVLGAYTTELGVSDGRGAKLKAFFRKYNSPLYDVADHIVAEADRNGFDYRLLAAIAMQESTLCKFIPEDSYNCWGWGIYGDTVTKFSSYEEAITVISEGIKEHYIDHGLVTASAIMAKYTPPSKGSWATGVNTVLKWLEE